MDRNLGSLDKATVSGAPLKTYGMYFQWGRKDPFPGKAASTGAAFEGVTGPVTTEYSVQNPTVYSIVGESDSAGNWNTEQLDNLWDEGTDKTIYDPCPAGYKVPAYVSTVGLWAGDNEGWVYNWDANNYAYGENVFPMAGWCSGGPSLSYEGSRSIILSANAHSSNARALLKIIRQDKGGFYYANYFKVEAASVRCVVE